MDYRNALFHTHTHTRTHTYDRWGPGGVFRAEESAGPPGDKAEGNDEDSMQELRFFWVCLSMHKMQRVPAEQLSVNYFKYLLPNGQLEGVTEPKTDTS